MNDQNLEKEIHTVRDRQESRSKSELAATLFLMAFYIAIVGSILAIIFFGVSGPKEGPEGFIMSAEAAGQNTPTPVPLGITTINGTDLAPTAFATYVAGGINRLNTEWESKYHVAMQNGSSSSAGEEIELDCSDDQHEIDLVSTFGAPKTSDTLPFLFVKSMVNCGGGVFIYVTGDDKILAVTKQGHIPVDLAFFLAHEFGHFARLNHSEPGTVMQNFGSAVFDLIECASEVDWDDSGYYPTPRNCVNEIEALKNYLDRFD